MHDLNPNIKAGEEYVLDENYNNASVVMVVYVKAIFAKVSDGENVWTVMKTRLTEKNDANRFIWEPTD